MLTVETEPKDPKRAVGETVLLIFIPLAAAALIGWAAFDLPGLLVGVFLGSPIAFAAGLARKHLFTARVKWEFQ